MNQSNEYNKADLDSSPKKYLGRNLQSHLAYDNLINEFNAFECVLNALYDARSTFEQEGADSEGGNNSLPID